MTDEIDAFLQTHARTFMLSTRADGSPTGHPLTGIWFGGALYFSTYGKSAKVMNVRRDPRVCCVVTTNSDEEPFRAVMIKGKAEILEGDSAEAAQFFEAASRSERRVSAGELPSGMKDQVMERMKTKSRVLLRVKASFAEDLQGS